MKHCVPDDPLGLLGRNDTVQENILSTLANQGNQTQPLRARDRKSKREATSQKHQM